MATNYGLLQLFRNGMRMGILEDRANLSGKVAAVIGGGGGLGRATSLALAEAGLDLAILDNNLQALGETAEEAKTMGRRVLAHPGDVMEPGDIDRFYRAIGDAFERLDVVVNLAGGVRQRDFLAGAEDADEGDIRRNFGYVIQSIRLAAPLIQRSGRGGSIINFTTIEAHRGAATYSVYAAAKAATSNLTRALAVELGAVGIRINELAPDATPSEGNLKAVAPERLKRWTANGQAGDSTRLVIGDGPWKAYIPLGAPPDAEDLANAVLFLASDLAAFITGATLHVDGGTSAALGFLRWPHGDGFGPAPTGASALRLFTPTTEPAEGSSARDQDIAAAER